MKLGLARHFQVPHNQLQLLNREGFNAWTRWYDGQNAEAPKAGNEFGTWDVCYCSDLPRALATAKMLFRGSIRNTSELREVPFGPFFPGRVIMPLLVWQAWSRLGWLLGHGSQPETRTETHSRVAAFLRRIRIENSGKNVLLVSHGFLMQILGSELRKTGFRGKIPLRPHWGRVYTFEE